jgi:hypothetical protein
VPQLDVELPSSYGFGSFADSYLQKKDDTAPGDYFVHTSPPAKPAMVQGNVPIVTTPGDFSLDSRPSTANSTHKPYVPPTPAQSTITPPATSSLNAPNLYMHQKGNHSWCAEPQYMQQDAVPIVATARPTAAQLAKTATIPPQYKQPAKESVPVSRQDSSTSTVSTTSTSGGSSAFAYTTYQVDTVPTQQPSRRASRNNASNSLSPQTSVVSRSRVQGQKKIVYSAMLSRVAEAFQDKIVLQNHVKDGLDYKLSFTGKDAVVRALLYVTKSVGFAVPHCQDIGPQPSTPLGQSVGCTAFLPRRHVRPQTARQSTRSVRVP